ncbi:MAG: response regulator [Pseudomonadales bacterium]|nr:response regulator [Pseudomonadales bacterium]
MVKSIGIKLQCLIYLCIIFSSSPVYADEELSPVRLFSKKQYLLSTHMYVLEDKTNKLTIDDVSSRSYTKLFVANDEEIRNFGVSTSTYWLRCSVEYPSAYPNINEVQRWYLEVGDTQMDVAELYISEFDGVFSVLTSDVRTNYEARPVRHVNSVFPVDIILGQHVVFYIKINKVTSFRFPLTMWTESGFVEKVAIEEFLYGLLYGGMLILMIYNLFLYISTREISYIYYVSSLFSVLVLMFLELGHGLIQFENIFWKIDREYIVYPIWFSVIFSMLFAKSFMHTKENYHRINSILNGGVIIGFMSIGVNFFVSYDISAIWNSFANMLLMPAYIGIIFYIYMKGNINAKYFFIAWLFNIFGFSMLAASTSKVIPMTPFVIAATPVGILMESLLFSFALANRIKNDQSAVVEADKTAMSYMEQYQSVFDHAFSGMYEMTLKGELVNVNPAMAKIFGFDNVKDFLKHNASMIGVLFNDPHKQFVEMVEAEGICSELSFRRRNSENIWVRHSAKLIVGGSRGGHIEGFVEDITQSKLKERAIFEKEQQIVEKNIAEKTARAKSEFLANMNHEIRTPLAAIIGFSEALKEVNILKEEKDKAVGIIVANSHVLLNLINDILDFSKIEAAKLEVEKIPVSVFDVVNEIQTKFTCKAGRKNLKFDIVYRYPIPSHLLSDPMRINQVLINICSNAIKFTDYGSVMLIISWDGDVNKLKFEVVDSGLGISDQIQENLFQVFNQADTSATRQYGGAGLGLAISKQLAKMMGGDIEVLSRPGSGSVFTFTVAGRFPQNMMWIRNDELLDIDGVISEGKGESRKTKSPEDPKLTGTVLLAEDNIVNQKLIERILRKFGLDVVVVSDGVEVCDYCDDCSNNEVMPDVILMDINMPNRDGLEATKYLRRKQYTLPIYALTAETSNEEISKALDAGCDGFLSKPLDRKLLFNALAENLLRKLPESK